MDLPISSGLLGGLIAIAISTYISKNIRDSLVDGELRFGNFLIILAWVCLGFSVLAFSAFFYDNDVWEKSSEFLGAFSIFVGFGLSAIYFFGEYFKVHGSFDDKGITFQTPWTGKKEELWGDLLSVTFNSSANWYVLKFKSGNIIRLSTFISGYGKVLELLDEKGYDF